jgi:hypothetical protein
MHRPTEPTTERDSVEGASTGQLAKKAVKGEALQEEGL